MNVKSLNKEFQLFVLQMVIKHLEKLHWSYRIPGSPNFYLQGHACLDRSIGCFRHLVSQRYWRNQSHEESTWSSPLGRKKRRVCFEEGHFPVICEQLVKLMFAPVGLVTWNCWEGIHSLQHKGWYLNDATSSDAIWFYDSGFPMSWSFEVLPGWWNLPWVDQNGRLLSFENPLVSCLFEVKLVLQAVCIMKSIKPNRVKDPPAHQVASSCGIELNCPDPKS